jgi:hypothetical protein
LLVASSVGLPAHILSAADALAPPRDRVILSVTGRIERANAPDRADFDRAGLERLGMTEIVTSTDWTQGKKRFEGPLVRDVLTAVGASGTSVYAVALNGYRFEIPVADFARYPVILALKSDGQYMSVREKGPIWIVYPQDQHPELDNAATKNKWIWNLRTFEVR